MKRLLIFIPLFFVFNIVFGQYQFIENKGQWNKKVLYKAYVDAGEVYLENDGIRFLFYDGYKVEDFHKGLASDSFLDCHAIKLQFEGAQKPSSIETSIENPTYYNYFLGNNRTKWVSNAKAYEKIVLKNIYPGVDFELYSFQFKLKYNFYIHQGAKTEDIKIRYFGADDVLEKDGNIHILTSLRNLVEEQPYSYQKTDEGYDKEIKSRYILQGDVLSFEIDANYRKDKLLIIDPTVVFATFSGSTADNFGFTATYDDHGNAYSGGTVYALGFPVTLGAFQLKWKDGVDVDTRIGDIRRDVGILKYSDDGTKLLYATYIGGKHNEDPHSMVVNHNDELLIFGNTGSSDFPVSISAYDTSFNGSYDIFVAKLSADGKRMLACTYLGGSDKDGLNGQQILSGGVMANSSNLGFNYGDLYRGEIIVDQNDQVFIATTTRSDDFPLLAKAYQDTRSGKQDAVLFSLNEDLSQYMGGTYFGGSENDAAYGIGINNNNHIFICGGTASAGLQFGTSAFQDTLSANVDGFIAQFSIDFEQLIGGTYFGTAEADQIYFIQIDKNDGVYVTGQTFSDAFPVKNVQYSQAKGKQFISKFSPNLSSLEYSGVFGSGRKNPDLSPSAFLVDQCARIYFTGWGGDANFGGRSTDLDIPLPLEAEKTTSLGSDFYLAVFAENLDTILYGSYFGGDTTAEHVDGGTSRYNRAGIVYQSVCAGCGAGSSDFPVTKGVVSEKNQSATGNLCNNALFKVDFDAPVLFADFDIPEAACYQNSILPDNRSINALGYFWDFGDGKTSTAASPNHVYADTGKYTITLIVDNIYSCPGKDTLSKEIYLYKKSDATFNYLGDDCGRTFAFKNESKLAQTFHWRFGDGGFSKLENPTYKYSKIGIFDIRLLTDSGTACADSSIKPVVVDAAIPNFTYLVDSCEPYVNFFDQSTKALTWLWEFEKGSFNTDNDPGHYFPDTGYYNVVLRINVDKICYDSIIKTIHVKNIERRASIDLQLDSCNFSILAINNSVYHSSIKWLGDTLKSDTLTGTYKPNRLYKIGLVADPFSTCPDTSIRFFEFDDTPIAEFEILVDTCLSKIETINNSVTANAYKWTVANQQSNLKNPVFLMADTGTFQIRLIANPYSSCADTFYETAVINLIKYAEFDIEPLVCTKAVVLTDLSKNAQSYTWDYGKDSNLLEIKGDTLYFPFEGNQRITLIIDKENSSCSDTFSLPFIITPMPIADFEVSNGICNALRIFNNKSIGSESLVWTLNDTILSQEESFSYLFKRKGKYKILLTITDENGCTDTVSKTIKIETIAKADFDFAIDTCAARIVLENKSVDAESLNWYINQELISSDKDKKLDLELEPGEFTVLLTINEGSPCADSISTLLELEQLDYDKINLPNIITPNGDGKNDVAYVQGLPNACKEIELVIFDRWGVKVYEEKGENVSWSGQSNKGKSLLTGVYFYFLHIGEVTKNGSITVLR